MYLADYHMHSKYSFDGHEEIIDICEEALRKGLHEIAITDHYDLFTDGKYARNVDFKSLYEDITKAKELYSGRLIVKAGIELGQPQVRLNESQDFLSIYDLDFVIGSVHNLEDALDVGEYDFRKKDIQALYFKYLEALTDMAIKCDFDVMGHITYPMRYVFQQIGSYPNLYAFREPIKKLYKLLIEQGRGIEVNASGFFQLIGRSMPDIDLVKLYKECGGEIITVGCDAHYLKHIGVTIEFGLEVVREAGFKYITTYEKRKPSFKRI